MNEWFFFLNCPIIPLLSFPSLWNDIILDFSSFSYLQARLEQTTYNICLWQKKIRKSIQQMYLVNDRSNDMLYADNNILTTSTYLYACLCWNVKTVSTGLSNIYFTHIWLQCFSSLLPCRMAPLSKQWSKCLKSKKPSIVWLCIMLHDSSDLPHRFNFIFLKLFLIISAVCYWGIKAYMWTEPVGGRKWNHGLGSSTKRINLLGAALI